MAASFKDLIPLRERAGTGEVTLERPSQEEVNQVTERTKQALSTLIAGASAAQKPGLLKKQRSDEPTYVKYTPAEQFGQASSGRERLIKIQDTKHDPMEPPKHKMKRIPRGPPSPPRPLLRSPPRKLTAEDQAAWRIPPAVSSWKNPKGYTRGIDKLLVARPQIEDVTINDRFSQFADALFTADRHARDEVKQRATLQQKLAEKEKAQKEEHLRTLARKAREERSGNVRRGRRDSSGAGSRSSRGSSRSYSRSGSVSSDDSAQQDRERARRERKQEREKQLRQSRMGTQRRMQVLAREQNRDISEKIALGLAKPTQSAETMYDSRLFNQTSGFDTGFNEDQAYDKPLFAAQEAINSIYRPTQAQADEEEVNDADAGAAMEKITKQNRFEVLGKAAKGFKGAEIADERRGPVVFERDRDGPGAAAGASAGGSKAAKDDDPFGIDEMIRDATGGVGGNGRKRAGDGDEGAGYKRARVDSDED